MYKYDEGDINVILEILYNRYDMMAQMECFVRRTEGKQRTTRNRCLKKMKAYNAMLLESDRYHALAKKQIENGRNSK